MKCTHLQYNHSYLLVDFIELIEKVFLSSASNEIDKIKSVLPCTAQNIFEVTSNNILFEEVMSTYRPLTVVI